MIEPIIKAGISGGLTGGALGGIGAALSKDPLTREALIKAMLSGAATYGGLGAGSTAVGLGLLGKPKQDEPSGYARRGAVGGAVGGSLAGGSLGALVGSGKMKVPQALPSWVAEYASKLKGGKGALIGAGVGALGLGAAAAYTGGDEGMQLDFIENELRNKRRDIYG